MVAPLLVLTLCTGSPAGQLRAVVKGALLQDAFSYPHPRGTPRLREAFAGYLESTFMKVRSTRPQENGAGKSLPPPDADQPLQGVAVNAEHVACLVGCGAILDVLFHSITAAGDGVLIPAPYYPAFPNDLEVRRSAVPNFRRRAG